MFNQAIEHRFYDVIRPRGIFGEHEKKLAISNRCVLNSQIQHRFGNRLTNQMKPALYNYVIKEGIP